MTNQSEIVIIRTITAQDIKYNQIPIQISVIKYMDGKQINIYDSLINPMKYKDLINLPTYLNEDILNLAPSPYTVAKEIEDLIQDCDIDFDEPSIIFLESIKTRKNKKCIMF